MPLSHASAHFHEAACICLRYVNALKETKRLILKWLENRGMPLYVSDVCYHESSPSYGAHEDGSRTLHREEEDVAGTEEPTQSKDHESRQVPER